MTERPEARYEIVVPQAVRADAARLEGDALRRRLAELVVELKSNPWLGE
jgi:hypothetical protein